MMTSTNQTAFDCFEIYEEPHRSYIKAAIATTCILVQVIGTALCGSLISYEFWGETTQYRTILNKLFSQIQFQCIRYIWILNTVLLHRCIFGPISVGSAIAFFFVPKVWTGFCALFLLNEMIIVRFLSIFVWKRLPPINETFFLVFLVITNEVLAFVLSIWGVMGYNVEQDTNFILTGLREEQGNTPIFRFFFTWIIITAFNHVLLGVPIGFKKLVAFWQNVTQQTSNIKVIKIEDNQSQDSLDDDPIESQVSISHHPNAEQDTSGNQDFIIILVNLICFCFIIFVFANYLFISGVDTVLTIVIGFFTPEFFFSIVLPAVYFKRHPVVLTFLLRKVKDCFQVEGHYAHDVEAEERF